MVDVLGGGMSGDDSEKKLYWVKSGGRVLGPFSSDRVARLVDQELIGLDDRVRSDGVKWVTVATLLGCSGGGDGDGGTAPVTPPLRKPASPPPIVSASAPKRRLVGRSRVVVPLPLTGVSDARRSTPGQPPVGGEVFNGAVAKNRRTFRQRVNPVLPPREPLGGGVTSPLNPSQQKPPSRHAIAVVAVAGCLMLAVGLVAVNSGSNARGQAAGTVTGAASDSGSSTQLTSYSRQEGDQYVVGISSGALDAIRQEQVGSNWCWAACIQLVLRAHGFERSQSEIVQRTFGDTRDSGANLIDIKGNLEGWSLQRGGQPYVLNCEVTLGPPSLAYMVEQLKQARPLIVAYQHAEGGHAVVITGVKYRKDASGVPMLTEIVVRDPGAAGSSSRGRRVFGEDEYRNCDCSFYVIPIQ